MPDSKRQSREEVTVMLYLILIASQVGIFALLGYLTSPSPRASKGLKPWYSLHDLEEKGKLKKQVQAGHEKDEEALKEAA
jgi:hypothetical protein